MLSVDVTPKEIASWFVNNVDRDAGDVITHLKLQKLVYYAEAWFLANYDRSLFNEAPQAWMHGPVYRSLYDKYKQYSWDTLSVESVARRLDKYPATSSIVPFLKACLEKYGQFSAKKLEQMTHAEEPWIEARGGLPAEARCENNINKLSMRNFYGKRIGKPKLEQLPGSIG